MNKQKHRPMVRAPEEVVGRWRHYDIILKSHQDTEDAWQFDKDARVFDAWLTKNIHKFTETLNDKKDS